MGLKRHGQIKARIYREEMHEKALAVARTGGYEAGLKDGRDALRLEVQRLRNQLSAHADALVDIADLPDMSDIRRALRDQAQVIRASASNEA